MPARMNTKTRKQKYRSLVKRDGEYCQTCAKYPPEVRLEIDHVDANIHDNRLGNLRLLCVACNRADGNRRRTRNTRPSTPPDYSGAPRSRPLFTTSTPRREDIPWRRTSDGFPTDYRDTRTQTHTRESDSPKDRHDPWQSMDMDPTEISPEIALSAAYYARFESYVVAKVAERGRALKKELINAACRYTGCKPPAGRQYMDMLTSWEGPLQEQRTPEGTFISIRAGSGA